VVIAPEPGEGINKQTSRLILLRKSLLLSALIFAGLQCWRPYFFLTDDNLDGAFPFYTEMGHRILSGHSPFITTHLFGGHYNFLHDPSSFAWHPLYLIVSLLAGTPFHNAIIDVDAFALFMLATAGFVTLAHYLRREMALPVSDGWIIFYALSYTYTMIALTTGASWLTFLGNHSALPWLVLGILQNKALRGLGLVALFSLHQVLGGHLAPTVSSSIILSFFALGLSISRKSWLPLANWLIGYAVAVVVMAPLLLPMLHGFSTSYRSHGVTLEDMQANNIPVQDFPTSIFAGMTLWLFRTPVHPYTTYTLALGSSAAVWCLIATVGATTVILAVRAFNGLLSFFVDPSDSDKTANKIVFWLNSQLAELKSGLPKWQGLEVVTLVMMIIIAVLICRPILITEIMMRLPLFRSMRWPFREFVEFQFFLHLLLVLRPPELSRPMLHKLALFGTFVFVVPLLLYPFPPTFNTMNWDRELVLTGGCQRYWDKVRPLLKPTDRIAVLIPLDLYLDDRFEEPYSLLGTYDYAELADVVNAWGYSPTAPLDQLYTKTYAFYPFGAYRPEQKQDLMAEKPGLKFITLESLHPLKITLSSRDGPTIDLTPFVPVRHSKIPPGPVPRDY
jgi:hypothetical protein